MLKSFELIFALFAVEITLDTTMLQPEDTNVYFLNSPISFCVANDWAGLGGGGVDTSLMTSVVLQVIVIILFSIDIIVSL